ncbi:hypothetical protein AGLY_015188 [Aphis glycines]|uniref:C2H2-type domain-containing protein n=1 Tax=Aphis glycines TaxID=307491 RepID=A0A6G0T3I6_APHGL|nr:hypothetical protein AGLY_015188 [Aphis glycines]
MFSCSVCEKAFTLIKNLHRHTKSHESPTKIVCSICSEIFTRKITSSDVKKKNITHGYRTKRRKIQKELIALGDWTNSPCEDELITPNSNTVLPVVLPQLKSPLNFNLDNSLEQFIQFVPENCIADKNHVLQTVKTVTTSDSIKLKQSNKNSNSYEENVIQSLQEWYIQCNVHQNSVTKLLKILKHKANLLFLPETCRTLLHTESTKLIGIREVNPGVYYHYGFFKSIIKYSSTILNHVCIKIAVGVDGLPISKNSSGIYYGNEKPQDNNEYLKDFISEVIDLTNN